MALVVIDGWLVGDGVRSSFALRSADVREGRMWNERMDGRERLLLTDGSDIRLRGITFDSAARATLDAWRRAEPASGEPTFPPARVHPQELARWNAWWPFGMVVAWGPNLAATFLKVGHAFTGPFLVAFLVGAVVKVFGVGRVRRLQSLDAEAARQQALAGQAPPLQKDRLPEIAEARITAKRL